jgi:hypothetical protein
LKGGRGEDNAGMIFPQNIFLDSPSESTDNRYDLRGVHLSPKGSKGRVEVKLHSALFCL